MPPVKFDRIVSCSSEDPTHLAKNLLLGKDANRKWKCKDPGEERATVIIQLSQPCIISGIDIGNEGSSFVEVLVSRTSTPDDFQVLLVMSSFMTPMDARAETNKNRVRMFSLENLSDPIKREKWDRVKVVCTQPFNKHLKYGLSFLILHTSEPKHEVSVKPSSAVKNTLGRFTLKDDDDEAGISIGNFFSRRKDLQASPPPSPAPSTGAAAVRDAFSPSTMAEQKAIKKRKGSDDLTDSQKKKRDKPKNAPDTQTSLATSAFVSDTKLSKVDEKMKNLNSNQSKEKDCKRNSSPVRNKVKRKKNHHEASSSDGDIGQSPATHTSSRAQSSKPHSAQPLSCVDNVIYKPFKKLFEDVEFVISGYQNPGRSDIRDKAVAMGARYNREWGPASTHLICAFPNTPKLQEVKQQGRGIVVIRDWVDDCYQERKKLGWRKYATVVSERKDVDNSLEPEVWELIPVMTAGSQLLPATRRNNVAAQGTRLDLDSEDSEDEIERIRLRQNLKKQDSNKANVTDTNHHNKVKPEKKKDAKSVDNEAYNHSTDVDSEEEAKSRLIMWSQKQSQASRKELPHLPDFFHGKTFYLSQDLSDSERQRTFRYITAFGGEVTKSQREDIDFVISNKNCTVSEDGKSVLVTPEWIWECNDQCRLISPSLYEP